MHYGAAFAEVLPINVGPQLLASNRPRALPLDRDHQAFAHLLVDRYGFAQVAQARFAAVREVFLL